MDLFEWLLLTIAICLAVAIMMVLYPLDTDPYVGIPTVHVNFSKDIGSSASEKQFDGISKHVGFRYYLKESNTGDMYYTENISLFNTLNRGGEFSVKCKDYYIFSVVQ